jgi:hypothetical protein
LECFEKLIFEKDNCYLALIGEKIFFFCCLRHSKATKEKDCNGKQEKGPEVSGQKKPEPFAPNNKKCYTFVFQIFYDEETTNG